MSIDLSLSCRNAEMVEKPLVLKVPRTILGWSLISSGIFTGLCLSGEGLGLFGLVVE